MAKVGARAAGAECPARSCALDLWGPLGRITVLTDFVGSAGDLIATVVHSTVPQLYSNKVLSAQR